MITVVWTEYQSVPCKVPCKNERDDDLRMLDWGDEGGVAQYQSRCVLLCPESWCSRASSCPRCCPPAASWTAAAWSSSRAPSEGAGGAETMRREGQPLYSRPMTHTDKHTCDVFQVSFRMLLDQHFSATALQKVAKISQECFLRYAKWNAISSSARS